MLACGVANVENDSHYTQNHQGSGDGAVPVAPVRSKPRGHETDARFVRAGGAPSGEACGTLAHGPRAS